MLSRRMLAAVVVVTAIAGAACSSQRDFHEVRAAGQIVTDLPSKAHAGSDAVVTVALPATSVPGGSAGEVVVADERPSRGYGSASSTSATKRSAPRDVRVQVGAAPPNGEPLPFSYTRYYPERLRVHRGQTILFENAEPVDLHTVTFLPRGQADRPPVFRSNEEPEPVAVNEKAWQRSACGGQTEEPCRLSREQRELSSGLSAVTEATWRVIVDLPAGSSIEYFCSVHPGMAGTIEVVGGSEPVPSQAQIDAQTRHQVEKDTREAIKHQARRDADVVRRAEGGRDVWRVLIGDSTPSRHVSIMAYMPSRLDGVRPGDAVEFISSGIGHHSVAFPTELVGHKSMGAQPGLAFAGLHPTCDLDELNGGAPGVPGPWAPFSPLRCPGAFELVLSPWVSSEHRAPADLVATPATYHDSGLMWSESAPDLARARPDGSGFFPHRFVAEFLLTGTFGYACTIHGAETMAGTIQVEG